MIQQAKDALAAAQVTAWDLAAALGVLVIAYPVASFVRRLTIRSLKRVPDLPDAIAEDGGRITRWVVFLIALSFSLNFLGLNVGWVAIVLLLLLIVAVLMLRPMVENSAAGMLLTMRPSFAVGDQIETNGHRGTVIEIGSRSTVLRTSEGLRIHVPNTSILSEAIVVYTAFDSRKTSFDITVSYGTDLDEMTPILLNAISGVQGVQDDPAPAVEACNFHDRAITLSVSYWYPSSMSSGSSVTDGVIRAVHNALTTAHIELAPPTLDVEAVEQQQHHNRHGHGGD